MRPTLKAAAGVAALGLAFVTCCSSGPPSSGGGIGGQGTSRRASSTGGAGTGGSGSTSGGSASCNASPGSCPAPDTVEPLNDCSGGQVELVANLVDFNFTSTSEPITCPIRLTNLINPSLSVSTDLCGYIRYCVTPGTEVSFQASVNGYIPMNFATLVVGQSTQIQPGIPMARSALQAQLPTFLPNANTSDAMVIVEVQPENPSPKSDAGVAGQACANKQGWALWLVDANGDFVDAGLAYLVNDTLDPTATGTDPTGFAFFYNVDPGLQTVQPRGARARDKLPDGGVLCGNPESAPPLGFTGSVPVLGGDLSVIPYVEGPN
jgi:hypothetical protein